MAESGTTIATAYVQILPSTQGIASGIANALGGGAASGAASGAGATIGGIFGGAFGKTLARLIPGLGIAGATAGMVSFGKASVQTGMEFDAAMSQVYALMSNINGGTGLTADEMELLRTRAREMGSTTQFTAAQVADAMGYMALAGWKVDEVYKNIPSILGLAAASGMDLGQASDIVTDYMSAFSKTAPEAAQLVDVLAYAQANSNSTTFQFASAWQYAAANMNIAGQSAETVTSMLAYMANSGHKASTAGTELNAMFTSLTQAMDRNGNVVINNQNVALQDSEGHWRNFIDIIGDVQQAMSGIDPDSPQYVAELMSTFGNVRSMRAIATLLNGDTQAMREFEAELQSAGGTAEKQAGIMNDNLAGDLKILNSAIDDLKISISDSLTPLLRGIVQTITPFFNWLSSVVSGKGINPFADLAAGLQAASQEDWEGTGTRIQELIQQINSGELSTDEMVAALAELNTLRATIANLDMAEEGEDVVLGVAKGMTSYDFAGDGDQVANAIIGAIDNALQAHSPAQALVPTGNNAAAGIGLGMTQYDFSTEGGTVGNNIAAGIAAGVDAGAYQIADAVRNAVASAYAAAKAELGINSPSRVFSEGVGRYISEGVAEGVINYAGVAENSVRQMTNGLIDAGNIQSAVLGAGSYLARASMAPAGQAGGSQADAIAAAMARAFEGISVMMDGDRVGRLTAKTVSREIEREARAGRFAT